MANKNEQIIRALRKIPLWDNLSDKELESVYLRCKPQKTAVNQVIFREGDPSHDLYVLLSGRVNIMTQKKGQIHTVTENETFGEIGLVTKNVRSATAISTSPCNMLRMTLFDFNDLLENDPRISALMMRNITTSLSQHIIRMNHSDPEYISDN
ncbi:MAG: cyclic nucleotide-binding domain-containing protein [Gammaproteobacteria bacterium]|nr:cyclic nucleotide-binding domain-containing protein [Gammaproteobacteria bacterium]